VTLLIPPFSPSALLSRLIPRDRICEYEKEKKNQRERERGRERGRREERGNREEIEGGGEGEKGDDGEEGALGAGEAVGEESAGSGGEMIMEVALGWRERPRHHDLGG